MTTKRIHKVTTTQERREQLGEPELWEDFLQWNLVRGFAAMLKPEGWTKRHALSVAEDDRVYEAIDMYWPEDGE